ncbi:MAG: PAS domain-containing sensor histidine kinase [Curvibacter sp. RIFCSPHIGHO2_12_FULL_63_18]|uniref:sensor histidine kinase n=1 Tax=Rhodoferax sp. TaxID=50421 RepID=UPI0008D84130|nr:PAS domain S-box protein [Rhodoferax sp.]OGO96975.1 MAG: PAS domain-containing sensor histidine kinase [Curvibacter sp. GWA2_63_95]OGP01152.1 MAG: PAS domain-containing sensor histidine kinase [Curvibacter sp. RIFCSPHIGHO2_12_FULL_63_18]HCX80743.1 PAS domain-containing sensor histidine kinase [Rhodoferax sp.]
MDDTLVQGQEGQFRQIVEMAPYAIVMIGEGGLIEMVNRQAETIFGYVRSELLGQAIEVLLPERFRRVHPAHRGNFVAEPSPRLMGIGRDLYGRRKDGGEFPIEIGLTPIRTPEGMKVVSAIVDLSERKRQEEQFRQVVEMAPNGMVMIDKSGTIEMVNTQAESIFGYSRSELLGQSIDMLLPARFRGAHPHHRASYFSDPSPRAMGSGRDLYGLRKDGSEFPVEIGLNPILTATGVKILSAIVDITARKQSEQQLSNLVGQLTRSNDDLNNFAYVASHDLKSPLRGVDQLATWIAEDLGDSLSSETQDHLRLMRSRISRMEMLLDDLLAYSRVGQSDNPVGAVNTGNLVRDIFELAASRKNIALVVAEDMPIVRTQKVPLELVLRNLINNAIKHHDKPVGTIRVHARPCPGGYEFTVQDDGPGIPPEHQKRVFTIFQTLKPRDEVEGSGMGLAIVKKAVETVGGVVTLESDGQTGCAFRFTWPTQPD